jgi:ATP-dependent exoDNAse (exonuclease V) alpha subunit
MVSQHNSWTYGYVTSHSSEGQTADRVLVHIDLERAGESLVNRRLTYVALSRGRYDAQTYTNDKTQLAAALDGDRLASSGNRARPSLSSPGADARAVAGATARHRLRDLNTATDGHPLST